MEVDANGASAAHDHPLGLPSPSSATGSTGQISASKSSRRPLLKVARAIAPPDENLIDRYLPAELLAQVFRSLDSRSRCRGCSVSRRWRDALYQFPELWTNLEVSRRSTLGGEKFLDLHPSDSGLFTDRVRDLLAPQGSISTAAPSRLALEDVPIDHTHTRFSRITRLDMSCTYIDLSLFQEEAISSLLGNTLKHLVLNGCPLVTSGSLYQLSSLKVLSNLELSHCDQVDDSGLAILASFVPWIKALNLSYLFRVTETGVKSLFKMPNLTNVNLIGCCRIKNYPWAVSNDVARGTLPIKDISIGEDSRIQTRGFWLLWCHWSSWNMEKLVRIAPFLETLRLNIVLFELPPLALETLLGGCKLLKNLSLVVDRNLIPSVCKASSLLQKLSSLDLTVHIGVTTEMFSQMVAAKALTKLTALKFHSKHSTVFNDESLSQMVNSSPVIEFLEINCEDISTGLQSVPTYLGKCLKALMLHHCQLSKTTTADLNSKCKALKELTITDLEQRSRTVKLSNLLMKGSPMTLALRKIELASTSGYSDKDLATIPVNCPNLQCVIAPDQNSHFKPFSGRWVDFQFSFAFPKTIVQLGDRCSNLLYLRLVRISPIVPVRVIHSQSEASSAQAETQSTNNQSTSNGRRRQSGGMATVAPSSSSSNNGSQLEFFAKNTTTPVKPLNSSPESRALVRFASRNGRKLRVLDLTGNVGLTDHVLTTFSQLPKLHTVFLDGVEHVTEAGIVKFAEKAWKGLKRLHLRGCRGCRFSVVGENYITRSLEVDLVVDGGRIFSHD